MTTTWHTEKIIRIQKGGGEEALLSIGDDNAKEACLGGTSWHEGERPIITCMSFIPDIEVFSVAIPLLAHKSTLHVLRAEHTSIHKLSVLRMKPATEAVMLGTFYRFMHKQTQ